MAGFDNLRQEAMRRVKEMQQNASSQENSSKRQTQNRNDGRGNVSSPQPEINHGVHNSSETKNFSSGQSGHQNAQSQNQNNSSINLESLVQSFNGDDIKAAKTGGEVLDACFHDKEKSLILILILLLSSDNADTGLLLALMYLLI